MPGFLVGQQAFDALGFEAQAIVQPFGRRRWRESDYVMQSPRSSGTRTCVIMPLSTFAGIATELGRSHVDETFVRRYLTYMRTTVSTKGQIILPAEIRRADGIAPGQEFEVERIDAGEYRLVRRKGSPNAGLVDWLSACPAKGFFISIESESTDRL